MGGRVEEGTSKGSTTVVVYVVVLESYQTVCPHKRFKQKATGKEVKEEKNTFKTITYSLTLINRKPLRNHIRKPKKKDLSAG